MWLAFPAGPYIQAASGRQHAQGQGGDMLRAVQNVGDVVMLTDVVTDLKHQVSFPLLVMPERTVGVFAV